MGKKTLTRPGSGPVVSDPMFGSMLNDLDTLSAGLPVEAMPGPDSSMSSQASPSTNDSSNGDSGPHRRSKRFLSYPRFVEVMVVADNKMVEHHGNNLQHYILTLMSIVSPAQLTP